VEPPLGEPISERYRASSMRKKGERRSSERIWIMNIWIKISRTIMMMTN